jgi:hypothetical protein
MVGEVDLVAADAAVGVDARPEVPLALQQLVAAAAGRVVAAVDQ